MHFTMYLRGDLPVFSGEVKSIDDELAIIHQNGNREVKIECLTDELDLYKQSIRREDWWLADRVDKVRLTLYMCDKSLMNIEMNKQEAYALGSALRTLAELRLF